MNKTDTWYTELNIWSNSSVLSTLIMYFHSKTLLQNKNKNILYYILTHNMINTMLRVVYKYADSLCIFPDISTHLHHKMYFFRKLVYTLKYKLSGSHTCTNDESIDCQPSQLSPSTFYNSESSTIVHHQWISGKFLNYCDQITEYLLWTPNLQNLLKLQNFGNNSSHVCM